MPRFRPLMAAATLIVLGAGPLIAQTAPADAPPPPPAQMGHHAMKHAAPFARLSVTGTGHATVQPDMATITLGVSTRAATAAEAMTQNAEAQAKVIETLKAEGIEARDIQTSGLNLSPVMDYSDQGQPPKLTGYGAQNSVTVRVRDIAGLGAVLDKLVASGANEISGIAFSREDMTEAEDQARTEAVAEARRRAEVMAEAAGMRLGRLISLSEAPTGGGPRPMMAMRAQAAEAADTPIEAGELAVRADVTAVFAMRPADAPQGGGQPEGEIAPEEPPVEPPAN
ncbi:SIMPL domain-containing protein [Paracoccus sp. P2]|uniref:SIMPL domain-containing protein n=1 Tax=Paracoccus pantotrophus TaxID=82367 RepID=A0A7H9BVK5_PARPN|nr:SIMPL domain-containing protein [Paracoccus pantotrophus]MDF3855098.1 SIMPL domain-containing protein [Paracoccus pantotrophus]QLH14838.1 SIMPL domain-containing protein [Paracoccus pantotrophus]RDD95979.1 SIMPL domain-containing protein [Paracoccus pantotrophus]RNI18010.1 SIMPL domain-containing protein [Paracoccus pantotrophus]WGR64984.1 SIMPL domain-containing protein [Paracoccus pantotrophus]